MQRIPCELFHFISAQNPREWRVALPLHRLPFLVPQNEKQLSHAGVVRTRVEDHGPPSFQPALGGMALGKPAFDIGERDFEQGGIGLDLVGDQTKSIRRHFVAGAFAGRQWNGRIAHNGWNLARAPAPAKQRFSRHAAAEDGGFPLKTMRFPWLTPGEGVASFRAPS